MWMESKLVSNLAVCVKVCVNYVLSSYTIGLTTVDKMMKLRMHWLGV